MKVKLKMKQKVKQDVKKKKTIPWILITSLVNNTSKAFPVRRTKENGVLVSVELDRSEAIELDLNRTQSKG